MRADERRQVVVVGSGFGGAVTACRLAQAGCDVLVLERGRWYRNNDFPRRAGPDLLWHPEGGPFDVHFDRDMTVVRAAGVGGGSLLYSNVHLPMPADGFADWPADWTREVLDPYYDLVASMLDLRTVADGDTYWPIPPRAHLLAEGAYAAGAESAFFYPPLAVNFGDPRTSVKNPFGVEQSGCRHCGKCSVGCNFGAKNSLDKNYLPLAVSHHAEIRDRCEVTSLAAEPGTGYRVEYTGHGNRASGVVVATCLVLAAGAIGTTGLLLTHGEKLGDLSRRVGEHYSANGDVVTGALGIEGRWRPTVGPAITAAIRVTRPYWYLVEDGGVPPMSVLARGVTSDDDPPCPPSFAESWEGVADVVGFGDVLDEDHAAIMLGMGRDGGAGRIRPGAGGDDVDIEWPHADNQAYYDAVVKFQTFLARRLGGHHIGSAHSRVSVHSLGGAVMADDPERGVVKPTGEVYGAPGLYVMDGAAIPSATGVNPSHTIAAVAERNAERLVATVTGRLGWRAPEFTTPPAYASTVPAP